MTNKEIQQLIDRYLEGETSPEEEKVLARELLHEDFSSVREEMSEGRRGGSPEWQAVRLMLGELAMGEAEYDAIMAKRQQTANRKARARTVSMRWRWTAAAASLLLLIGMGTMILMKKGDTMLLVKGNDTTLLVAQKTAQPLPVVADLQSPATDNEIPQGPPLLETLREQAPASGRAEGRGVAAPSPSAELSDSSSLSAEDPNLHYASLETNSETIPYQDPARVDEFIEKLASVHALPIELTCSATMDSTVTSAVCVFPDKPEVDVFGRLLQVACWYSDETPGYFLSFSHQQFFFELKDLRKELQYRWVAERVNGKILLYGTHSPIGTNVSSTCYQEYRDELMHTRSIQTKTLDI